jgi:hypothetical protein
MAHITGNGSPRGNHAVPKDPVGLGPGERGAQAIRAVAGLAGVAIPDEVLMPAVPKVGVIDIVQAVRAIERPGQSGAVAGGALGDFAGMALNLGGRDIIIGPEARRPFGVSAAVAGLAGHPAMAQAELIQGGVAFCEPLVDGDKGRRGRVGGHIGQAQDHVGAQVVQGITRVAGLTLGQVNPSLISS